ncbi:MAG: cell division protein FtsZ, partial [Lachnospiraceae bacterium]|nr:cell division protein FtsZ [Lachnospiraceae bacterium]
DLINLPALINLDFADVQTVMKDKGMAHIGIGQAKGDDKASEAVKLAVESPLLETTIAGASHVIINISGDISLIDANEAAMFVQDLAGENANIIFGAKYDDSMTDEATITVIATGLEETAATPRIMSGLNYGNTGLRNGAGLNGTARTGGASLGARPAGGLGAGTKGSSPYGSAQGGFGVGAGNGAANILGGMKRPESKIQEKDIKIPEFLKNTRK